MEKYLWLLPVGFAVGVFGTLIGAGGGFLLVPVLVMVYPEESPEIITSISLAVVFFNALSGSWAYARMRRIEYKSGLLFGAATIPGAVLGAWTTSYVSRQVFDAVLGLLMIAAAAFLLIFPAKGKAAEGNNRDGHVEINLVEKNGAVHRFSYNPIVGVGLSFLVGFVSSLLGIGGGIVHVPALVHVLNFPVHVATATSHFVLAIMALTGTIVHIATGAFTHGIRRTIILAIGVLIGAQVGAFISGRVRGRWILRALAIALAFVGIRILLLAW